MTNQPVIKRFIPLLCDILLLALALAAVGLPALWTRDLKRIQQPNWYTGLGLVYILIFGFVGWLILDKGKDDTLYRRRWLGLAVLVLVPNLLNIWVRYSFELAPGQPLFGRDADVGLFYTYGHAANAGLTPTFENHFMEYPQIALTLFQVGDWLAGGELQTFYWVFPAFMLVFQAIAAVSLYGIGLKLGQARAGYLLAVFCANCPFLFLFNYTRFDIAPTAMLLVAVYCFLPSQSKELRSVKVIKPYQPILTGLLVAIGGLIKWLPALIIPSFALAYTQAKKWRELGLLAGAGLLMGLVVLVPAYLANAEAFWYPYQFQGERKMIGESFWFLLQYFWLDPARTVPDRPWGEPSVIKLGNSVLTVLQLALTALTVLLPLILLWLRQRKINHAGLALFSNWAASGLITVAVFTLSNRIFSPQYLVLLVWVWAAALLLGGVSWRSFGSTIALITIAAGANFLVFLLGAFPDEWVKYSLILFVAAWLLCGGLLGRVLVKQSLRKIA